MPTQIIGKGNDAYIADVTSDGELEVYTGALTAGTDSVDAMSPTTTLEHFNTTLTDANTQYSQVLPAVCYRVKFQCRTGYDVRFSLVSGKVATPTAPYYTLKSGAVFDSGPVRLSGETIYFASAQAGVVVELEAQS